MSATGHEPPQFRRQAGSGTVRLAMRPAARCGAELARLLAPLGEVLRRRQWSGLSLAGGGTALLLACALAQQAMHGPAWLADATAERASLPLGTALERLPGSLFAPALNLPLWGAVAQLAVAAALAQAACGATRAFGVGFGGHLGATLAARMTLAVGTVMPLAMPAATRFVLDTGPSAATLALLAYVCARLRCGLVFTMVAAVPVVELIIWPTTLAGHEHLAAVVIGAIAALPTLLRPWIGRLHVPNGRLAEPAGNAARCGAGPRRRR